MGTVGWIYYFNFIKSNGLILKIINLKWKLFHRLDSPIKELVKHKKVVR